MPHSKNPITYEVKAHMKTINYYIHIITLPTTLKQALLLLDCVCMCMCVYIHIYNYVFIISYILIISFLSILRSNFMCNPRAKISMPCENLMKSH